VPVIAIAPCSKPHDYEAAIERAGGELLRLDRIAHRPADVIAKVDGVLLPGGGDVLPSLYGEAAHPKFSPAKPAATTTSWSWRGAHSTRTFHCWPSAVAFRSSTSPAAAPWCRTSRIKSERW
jgi:hypothetical protein